jgi:acetyltransferase-like isoleucine patch superfamily enzyme
MIVVQTAVCTAALLPVVALWTALFPLLPGPGLARLVLVSAAVVPSYAIAAVALPFLSAAATRLLGWRTPAEADMRIADLDWPVLTWAQAMAATHVVRLFSGVLLRGTPIWTAYLRLSGARVGRRVYVASLGLSDYNLLELGDDVVIGGAAHLSGHTVEHGFVRTARVQLGAGVTVGAGAVVEIGVRAGPQAHIGALAFVPKFSRLAAGGVYVGVPVRRIAAEAEAAAAEPQSGA